MNFSLDICHDKYLKEHKPLLSFDANNDYDSWRENIYIKLTELLGDMPQKTNLNIRIEWEKAHNDFTEKRFVFTSEDQVDVSCHLWIPKKAKKPCPVVICLQGHSTGMHISMGRSVYDGDDKVILSGDRDFAVQIIREGYAALVIEQRGFGERKSEAMLKFEPQASTTCSHLAMTALLIGRTLIGERVWDISRAIDVIETFPEIDNDKVAVMGNSGGGTISYYAACMDPRIKVVMPSCSVCSFRYSIGARRHCDCNYIPNIAKYVDMGDLACLIAPRPLIVVAGRKDKDFHIDGSLEVFKTIKKIYTKAGAENNCRLVIGNEGHRFYAQQSWPIFRELSQW